MPSKDFFRVVALHAENRPQLACSVGQVRQMHLAQPRPPGRHPGRVYCNDRRVIVCRNAHGARSREEGETLPIEGRVKERLSDAQGVRGSLMEGPVSPEDPAVLLSDLWSQFFSLKLTPEALDLRYAARNLECRYDSASMPFGPMRPAMALRPLPPQGIFPCDPRADLTQVPYEEVSVSPDADPASLVGLLVQPPPFRPEQVEHRVTVSGRPRTSIIPRELVNATDTPSAIAAREAATGRWLEDLDRGHLTAVAPGLGLAAPVWGSPPDRAPAQVEPAPSAARDDRIVKGKVTASNLFDGVWLAKGAARDSDEDEAVAEDENLDFLDAQGGAKGTNAGMGDLDEVVAEGGQVAKPTPVAVPGAGVDGELAGLLSAETPGAAATPQAPSRPGGKGHKYEYAIDAASTFSAEVEFEKVRPDLAMHYPFELDHFQKAAVCLLERGQNVFVAAHTSAGKTVVAEYAFALSTRHRTKAIYTSPIKTISNQKFRDFSKKFSVGLLTGDVSIKPESPCLIMTTEILRSMLYRGADLIRDVEWVVFDEVHYVNDQDRGVVWEEVIIMLPPHIGIVMLSATVPNVKDFAEWVGRTKRRKIYIMGTNKRPVPLEHFLYHNGKKFKVADGRTFYDENYVKCKNFMLTGSDVPPPPPRQQGYGQPAQQGRGSGRGAYGRQGGRGASAAGVQGQLRHGYGMGRGRGPNSGGGGRGMNRESWLKLIRTLDSESMLPALVFCFSKKKCDEFANMLNKQDFRTAAEKSQIHVFCSEALKKLKGSDRRLPQIIRVCELLSRGIGVHHAGLLPIVKEIVEMLFCRGLVSVLVCTETFAMGVNAPAKTVVFQDIKKFDSNQRRLLTSGEYTQMAGRAGRRGLDKTGAVLVGVWTDLYPQADVKSVMIGKGQKLQSQFRLTYLMICSLLRVEDLKVEDMMRRSFAEFHAQRALGNSLAPLQRAEAELAQLRAHPWPGGEDEEDRACFRRYAKLTARIDRLSQEVMASVLQDWSTVRSMQAGRVVVWHDASTGMDELAVVLAPVLGSETGPGGRNWYLLAMRHAPPEGVQRADEADAVHNGKANGKPTAQPVASVADEFANMQIMGKSDSPEDVLGLATKGPGGKGKKGGAKGPAKGKADKAPDPGPLPRLGECQGRLFAVVRAGADAVRCVCSRTVDLTQAEAFEVLLPEGSDRVTDKVIAQLERLRFDSRPWGWPEPLPLSNDLRVDLQLAGKQRELQEALSERAAMNLDSDPSLPTKAALSMGELLLDSHVRALKYQMSDANLRQLPEFQARLRVLQRLKYVSEERTIELKGRVMCEVQGGDELLGTEMLFAGIFAELEPEECVAVLSALVFQEKVDDEPALAGKGRLLETRVQVDTLARDLAVLQKECGVDVPEPDEWAGSVLKWGLAEAVYEWARGMSFEEICQLTSVMEGSIVRTVMRLDEQCRMMRNAAKIMGNMALHEKLEKASQLIKRDVIFAASLYIQ